MKRGRKFIVVLLLTVTVAIGVERTGLACEASRFIHVYRSVQKANAPINFWERLFFSLALANSRAANQQAVEAAASAPSV